MNVHSSVGRKHRYLTVPSVFNLIPEVGLNFFRLLRSLGISEESNLVVLSSKHNYSCNEGDLKNARIIINLRRLNLIRHLDLFLNSLVRMLPPGTSFIGCFSDEELYTGNSFSAGNISACIARCRKMFRSGKNHVMNRDEVRGLLEKNGFKTLNMKEMSGLTYFISTSVSMPR